MPIRPEEKARYPKEWKAIRARILERAGHDCEQCKRPNGAPVLVAPDGAWCLFLGDRWTDSHGRPTGARDESACHATKTVLTIAHLDHTPEHNEDGNLRAWCQRCHLTHDARHHASAARRTRARKAGQAELKGIE